MEHFIWLDMEMTGLNPEKDKILEIALIITDESINVIDKIPPITLGYKVNELEFSFSEDKYNELLTAFQTSGLLDRVSSSKITIANAEEIILTILKKQCEKKKCHLAGSSVWNDANFIIKYMPKVWDFLHYKLLDITGLKLLKGYWYPTIEKYPKKDTHDAMEDILESIEQLKYYREVMFK